MIDWGNRYCIRPAGLGIIITQLSFLLALRRPVVAVVADANHMLYDLKRIFQIPDGQLTIELGTAGWPDLETDELCTYAPYFHPDRIQLQGQVYSTQPRPRPCIALAMHHGSGLGADQQLRRMPYNKFASADQYNRAFQLLTDSGYDVITMNQVSMSIEQKIWLLNELCDAVVGYEGGLQHLAHVLKIPCIVFPWQYNDSGHAPEYPGMWYETHRFHADTRSWFLRTVDEFLAWTPTQLRDRIRSLSLEQGNNVLFEPGTRIDPDTWHIHSRDGRDLTPRIMWCHERGAYTTAFIKQHLTPSGRRQYPIK